MSVALRVSAALRMQAVLQMNSAPASHIAFAKGFTISGVTAKPVAPLKARARLLP